MGTWLENRCPVNRTIPGEQFCFITKPTTSHRIQLHKTGKLENILEYFNKNKFVFQQK